MSSTTVTAANFIAIIGELQFIDKLPEGTYTLQHAPGATFKAFKGTSAKPAIPGTGMMQYVAKNTATGQTIASPYVTTGNMKHAYQIAQEANSPANMAVFAIEAAGNYTINFPSVFHLKKADNKVLIVPATATQ